MKMGYRQTTLVSLAQNDKWQGFEQKDILIGFEA
jgi:hypothetical protein